jgi:hypothetical protein
LHYFTEHAAQMSHVPGRLCRKNSPARRELVRGLSPLWYRRQRATSIIATTPQRTLQRSWMLAVGALGRSAISAARA